LISACLFDRLLQLTAKHASDAIGDKNTSDLDSNRIMTDKRPFGIGTKPKIHPVGSKSLSER
jgi:hypothetical protein